MNNSKTTFFVKKPICARNVWNKDSWLWTITISTSISRSACQQQTQRTSSRRGSDQHIWHFKGKQIDPCKHHVKSGSMTIDKHHICTYTMDQLRSSINWLLKIEFWFWYLWQTERWVVLLITNTGFHRDLLFLYQTYNFVTELEIWADQHCSEPIPTLQSRNVLPLSGHSTETTDSVTDSVLQ